MKVYYYLAFTDSPEQILYTRQNGATIYEKYESAIRGRKGYLQWNRLEEREIGIYSFIPNNNRLDIEKCPQCGGELRIWHDNFYHESCRHCPECEISLLRNKTIEFE